MSDTTATSPAATGPGHEAPAAPPAPAMPAAPPTPAASPVASMGSQRPAAGRSIDLLHGVEMQVTVELGQAKLLVKDLLALRVGSIIDLDRSAGSPVDVLVNGTLLAHGEVVVIDDEFGVRITEILNDDAVDPGK